MPKQVTITAEVRAVLIRGTWDGTAIFRLPSGQLERPLYQAVNTVLVALGGKWSRPANGHVFSADARAQLTAALDAGVAVDRKRTAEQFFTPPDIADRMAVAAEIARGMHVLEPNAGCGRLVKVALECGATVTAIENDPILAQGLRMAVGNMHVEDRVVVIDRDFLLQAALPTPIDRVLMNPPFSRSQDIRHVTHAFGLLRPGGILVAIMSPSWTFAQTAVAREFRDYIYGPPRHEARWEQLPENTFRGEGTGVNAGILVLRKPV